MKIHLDKALATRVLDRIPAWRALGEQLRLGPRLELPLEQLDAGSLDTLIEVVREQAPPAARLAFLEALRPVFADDGPVFGEDQLEDLLPALLGRLGHGPHGWLFQLDAGGRMTPWLVSRIDFTPAGSEERARLVIDLKANSCGKLAHQNLFIGERDLGLPLARVLATKGFVFETAALVAAFEEDLARYHDWRGRSAEQFCGQGLGILAEDPTASHRPGDHQRKRRVVLSTSGQPARLVNDEAILQDRDPTLALSGDLLAQLLKRCERNAVLDRKVEQALERQLEALPEGMFTRLPIHPYLLMYHLELHHHLWVHVSHLAPYRYQPELKDKLVLPPEQVDLIDILTAEMDVLMDDIVAGKSGGTTVLCTGPAGVGKTLTAEVYSEIIGRPLYRVHSGQLGLDVASMEQTLREALIRAQRWGAVMLIDEADVYIRRRDDQIATNAVVGVFLRVLEYFNGLLFLTTNRMDDIDEAIVSRCIAMIRYHPPTRAERERIWRVMAGQFALSLDDEMPALLADRFGDATGRDIKGLAKLVAKYCSHKAVAPTMAVFERCATFRGMSGTRPAPLQAAVPA